MTPGPMRGRSDPNVSGHRNAAKLFTSEELEPRSNAEPQSTGSARLVGQPPMMVPMFSEDPDELCAFPRQFPEEYREAIESGMWNNETTIRSLENFVEFEPAGWIPYITPKPLLMIFAEHDVCTFTEVQREVYEATPEPKKLLTFDGGHFDAYTNFFDQTGPPAATGSSSTWEYAEPPIGRRIRWHMS